ncbi:hypothetical protein CGGC5_v007971 [Colletotrichum fructicola Nara gc5]|uniref:Gag protein n=1 Tax=Colletotrichum fructicola (strain Nara gc5) TaxID=1213859 RepID=L2GGC5_COLFN|nr:hypothetical protein CGGC5_v007971 [Colletotrichum fructicola Nara gc5]
MTTATIKTIELRSTRDWILWFDQLQSKAKSYDLWKHINPAEHIQAMPGAFQSRLDALMTAPDAPEISDHPSGGGANSAAVILDPDNDAAVARAENLAELSRANRELYRDRQADYTFRIKRYEARMKSIRALQDWIRDTADPELLRHCCTADKNLDEWIYELQKRVGSSDSERKATAKAEYSAVLQLPARKKLATKRDVEDWLTKWERAICEAQASSLPQAREADQWFPDYVDALSNSYIDNWIFSYHTNASDKAKEGTLTVGDVIEKTREFLRTIKNANPRAKSGRGAFGPTILGDADGATTQDSEQEAITPIKRNLGRRAQRGTQGAPRNAGLSRATPMRDGSRKRALAKTETEDEKLCPACLGLHPLSKCWIVFEDLRPERLARHEPTHRLVEDRINNDEELAERIRKLKLSSNMEA